MTSNPGDEKVIQDPVHFKDKTTHKESEIGTLDTGRLNKVVNLADYDTLQAAVDDVPRSGELYIPRGFHSVSEIGTAETAERITIRGAGAGETNGATHGSVIQIDEQITEPVIRIAPDSSSDTQMPVFKDIGFFITAGSPGDTIGTIVEIHDSPHAQFHRCYWNCTSRYATAIRTTGTSFSTQVNNCRVRRGRGTTVSFENSGGGDILRDSLISGSDDSNTEPAVYFGSSSDMQIDGGQIIASSTGDAVHVDGVDGGRIRCRFESVGRGVVLMGATEKVNISGGMFISIDDVCVDFVNCNRCNVLEPEQLINGSTSGVAVRWGADGNNCQVSGDFQTLAGRTWSIDANAYAPTVQFEPLPAVPTGARDGISDPVEGMTIYNTSNSDVESYDGAGWIST